MSRSHWSACLLSLSLFAIGGSLRAETIQPDEAASKDGFTYQFLNNSNVNLLFPNILAVAVTDGADAGHDLQSFLQFDLSSLGSATGVASATLRLFATSTVDSGFGSNPSAAHPITVDLFAATSTWNEATLTWGTKPSFEVVASATVVQNGINQEVLFDVTSLVNRWLSGSLTNNGLALVQRGAVRDDGNDLIAGVYASSGNATAARWPRLDTVALAPVPEPTSVALALFTLPALAWAARRRPARAVS